MSPSTRIVFKSQVRRILSMAIALILASCAAQNTASNISDDRDRESPAEAADVKAVLDSRRPQSVSRDFDGCWRGSVDDADTFVRVARIPSDSLVTIDCCLSVNYELCFDASSSQVRFTALGLRFRINSQYLQTEVVPLDNKSEVTYSSGKFAALRTVDRYKLYTKLLGVPTNGAFISSKSEIRATYIDRNKIYVEGAVEDLCSEAATLNCEGQTWVDSTWHGEFTKQDL